MGIESDQLVFDYLSRVGDLAQQRQLPAKERMTLVASLRDEIARQREGGGADGPAGVRRILDRLGSPDAVVTAVAGGGLAVPGQRTATAPRDRVSADVEAGSGTGSGPGSGDGAGPEPDWWSVVPGFTGGVEVPELLVPPEEQDGGDGEGGAAGGDGAGSGPPAPPPGGPGVRLLRRLLGRKPPPAVPVKAVPGAAPGTAVTGRAAAGGTTAVTAVVVPASPSWRSRLLRRGPRGAAPAPAVTAPVVAAPRRWGNPVLLAAAVLLVVGTVIGSWLALAGGWLLAYASRRLSRAQAKWAVLGLPGLVAAATAVWLWGRLDGRWGDPIAAGGPALREALSGTWPWTVRAAALASAAYLLWRSRRP
ncbi:HAAS signaling domain-containing protein [Streptomyces kanasensis]|uniref:HAAS signaling domain-containing protein n=1 Tax=Streptomyces kanasensis TaxID=936756 RepID=UPI0036F7AC58